jgi:hypothetical protein
VEQKPLNSFKRQKFETNKECTSEKLVKISKEKDSAITSGFFTTVVTNAYRMLNGQAIYQVRAALAVCKTFLRFGHFLNRAKILLKLRLYLFKSMCMCRY